MAHALVDQAGLILNIIVPPAGDWQPPDDLALVEVPDSAQIGDSFVNGELVPVNPPPTLDELKAAKLVTLAARRWQAESSGFVWQRTGTEEYYFIATDELSQPKLAAERAAAIAGLRRPGDKWKCGDVATGAVVFVDFIDSEILDMTEAARNRTSDCFNNEGLIAGQIMAAANAADLEAIDIHTGWPQ